jgi:hypothetical protein
MLHPCNSQCRLGAGNKGTSSRLPSPTLPSLVANHPKQSAYRAGVPAVVQADAIWLFFDHPPDQACGSQRPAPSELLLRQRGRQQGSQCIQQLGAIGTAAQHRMHRNDGVRCRLQLLHNLRRGLQWQGPSVQPANCWDLLGLASPRFNQPHLWRYRMTLSCTQQAEAGARNTLRCSVVRTLQPQLRGCPALGPIQARRQWKRGLTRHASTWQAFIASLPSLRHVRAGRQQQADVSCAVAQLPGCAHFPTHTSSGRPCPPVVRCGRHCGKGSGSNAAASHRQCRQRRQRKSDVARRCPTGRDGGAAAAEGVGSQVAPFLWPTLQQRRNKTTC